MKQIIALVLSFFISGVAFAETVYITIPAKQGETLVESSVTLRVDDAEVPITEFFRVDTAARTGEVLSHSAGRRQYLFVIDLINLNADQVLQIRKMAQDILVQIPRDDLFALAAITNEDGLRFFSGLTADRTKWISAWNAMGKVVLSGMTEGPEGNLYPSQMDVPLSFLSDEEFLANIKTYAVGENSREELAPLYIQAFVDLASLLSTLDGRKNVLLFSPGTDVKGLQVNLQGAGEQKSEEKEKTDDQHKTIREITQLGPRNLQAAAQQGPQTKRSRENDAGVVPRLLEGTDSHIYIFNQAAEENGFLKDLAEKTKGFYQRNSDPVQMVSRMFTSDESYYVAGWKMETEKEFHELHTIKVFSGGTKLDAPERWLASKPMADYSPLEKKSHVAQAIYQNLNSSEQWRFWSDVALDDGSNRIITFIQIPGPLLLQAKSRQLQLEFYNYALEPDGTILDFASVPISLDINNPKLRERLENSGLKVWNVLFGGHGPVSIKSVVVNTQTGETITNSQRLNFKDTEFLLSNPFFPSYNFDWIVWPKPDQPQTRRGHEIIYPYAVGADLFFPDLDPKIRPEAKDSVLYFKMYNFSPGEKYPAVELRLIGEDGKSIEMEQFGLLQQPRLVQRGGLELFWKIRSFPGDAKGRYRLQVDVTDLRKGKEVIRDIPATVE